MSNRQWDKMSLKRMIEMGLRADDYNLLRKLIPVLAIPAPRRTK